MSNNNKINLYVNSKNRRTDETASNFNIIIPDGLLKVNNDEEFELAVISFSCYNTFYHCNNITNKFQIIFRRSDNSVYVTLDYFLTNGNPNVYDILNNLNSLTSIYFTTSYNRITNKFTFTRVYAQDANYYNMYIKCINSGSFLGLNNNVEFLVTTTSNICLYPVNVVTIKALSIGIDGDISFKYNNMESLNSGVYKCSDLILVKFIDVYKNEMIKYENVDGCESFSYDLGNRDRIKYFTLSVYDQDGNTITDMSDYLIHLQFTIRKKDETKKLLKSVVEYSKENYLVSGHIFDVINKMFNLFINLISRSR